MSSPSSAGAAAARMQQLSSAASSSASDTTVLGSNGSVPSNARPLFPPKRILLLRHGQAVHNPRAESARENGCSFDEFLQLMEEDDQFDAALTELGESQATEAGRRAHVRHALRNVEMVVSSPLTRALMTADLVHPPPIATDAQTNNASEPTPRRVCIEEFREINGKLLNAQRLPRSELERNFPDWCFRQIPSEDETWRPDELESREACSDRGYRGLLWILQQTEEHVLLVCHGGLLNYTLNNNARVVLVDGRQTGKERCITKRFGNCEMRAFVATVWDADVCSPHEGTSAMGDAQTNGAKEPVITLEEVEMAESHALDADKEEKAEVI
ncbi:hypothetical protein ACHAXT_008619 [Thalassiosira profunda]